MCWFDGSVPTLVQFFMFVLNSIVDWGFDNKDYRADAPLVCLLTITTVLLCEK
jgi:hypothetical protein